MELTITKQESKPLLKFTEVEARISFHGATPTKKEVATSLSATMKTKSDLLIVRQVETKYGQQVAEVRARVYDNKEALEKLEQQSMIKKNDFTAKPKEAEAPAEAPKEEAPAAEKPADAPAEAPKEDAPQEKPKEEPPKEDKPEEKKEEKPETPKEEKKDAPKEEPKAEEKPAEAPKDKPKGDA